MDVVFCLTILRGRGLQAIRSLATYPTCTMFCNRVFFFSSHTKPCEKFGGVLLPRVPIKDIRLASGIPTRSQQQLHYIACLPFPEF